MSRPAAPKTFTFLINSASASRGPRRALSLCAATGFSAHQTQHSVSVLKDQPFIPIYAGREARPRRHPRSPDSNAVQFPTGASQSRPAAAAPAHQQGCPAPVLRRPARAQGTGRWPLVPLVLPPRRVLRSASPGAKGPGTAHPALSRPLLRTLTLPAVAWGCGDEVSPAPPWTFPGRMRRQPRRTRHRRGTRRAGHHGSRHSAGPPCATRPRVGPRRGVRAGAPAVPPGPRTSLTPYQRSAPPRQLPRSLPG